ncbi:alpha/beta fold hydrolase [Amnibacterium kyonggiense]|uniref:Pimeloyl-ACP methyl ester carboxylesterase n=1 Tax=Amnibacterium kyonggiense TaxID=595671 RepID=A0A4R7FL70_9MICO|nr:alpha/beta fold hydrolase [Amnibacterium kyonggiense]TDS77108.1 pimeloyl-ACP methyl ester carboxylesterase [Amnibacterium kyonggiense]
MRVLEVRRPAGGVLQAYDGGPTGRSDELAVFWHGGTPNTGAPPEPLRADAAVLGIRLIGADRPGYGGSTRDPEASIADVVPDVLAVADALGVARFAVLGHSGGGPRVLACAALAGPWVRAAVAVSSPAPPDAGGLDRFAGMAPGIVAEQRAAVAGRAPLLELIERDEFDERAFTEADRAALAGPWSWFGPDVAAAVRNGPDAQADDLLAAARPWGFDVGGVAAPVLVVHGADDRMVPAAHGAWLAERLPAGELRSVPGAGHISVLDESTALLRELRRRAG